MLENEKKFSKITVKLELALYFADKNICFTLWIVNIMLINILNVPSIYMYIFCITHIYI